MSDDLESMFVTHLRSLGAVATDSHDFDIDVDGVRIHVHHVTGSSSSVDLQAAYVRRGTNVGAPDEGHDGSGYRTPPSPRPLRAIRPLNLVLRPEDRLDVEYKAQGVNREVQTGDTAFDQSVYIDTPTNDATVLALLASPQTRDCARRILRYGAQSLRIDADDHKDTIGIVFRSFPRASPDGAEVIEMARAFAALVKHLPYVEPIPGAAHKSSGIGVVNGWSAFFTLLGVVGVVPFYLAMAPAHCIEHPEEGTTNLTCGYAPAFIGLAGGFLMAIVVTRLVRRAAKARWSGRSDSGSSIALLSVLTFLLCWLLGVYSAALTMALAR